MPMKHVALAVTVAFLWGINFIAIDCSLQLYPPFLLAALRFGLVAIPTVVFVRPPRVPWPWMMGYGLGFGVAQFGFLYWGMAAGMPAGLTSLVLQSSAPFTVILGALFFRDFLTPIRVIGITVAIAGLVIVGWHRAEHAALAPFLLTLAAGMGWAVGNLCSRETKTDEPFALMAWMTVIATPPLLLISLLVEGPGQIGAALAQGLTRQGLAPTLGVFFTTVVATLIGSGIWTWLLSRHPAATVAPFSLLVPVFGMTTARIVLDEKVLPGELLGAVIVVAGVCIGLIRRSPLART